MAINQLKYSQEFERQHKKGKRFAEADKAAIKYATKVASAVTKSGTTSKPKKMTYKKLVSRTAARLKKLGTTAKMAYHGSKYHAKTSKKKGY